MSHDEKSETKRTAIKVALATLQGKYEVRGHKMDVHVALCCYEFGVTPIRVGFKLESGKAWGHTDGERITVYNATRADIQALLESTLVDRTCARCKVAFIAEPKCNRGALCETCWLEDFEKQCQKDAEADRKALARQDAKMLQKGFTHRVNAWIHAGGDDRLVEMYTTGEPTTEEIQSMLKRRGSRVLNDYTVVDLRKDASC
jgi:hypothetical protein